METEQVSMCSLEFGTNVPNNLDLNEWISLHSAYS